jgi:hypothetical protein
VSHRCVHHVSCVQYDYVRRSICTGVLALCDLNHCPRRVVELLNPFPIPPCYAAFDRYYRYYHHAYRY